MRMSGLKFGIVQRGKLKYILELDKIKEIITLYHFLILESTTVFRELLSIKKFGSITFL